MGQLSRVDGETQSDQVLIKRHGLAFLEGNLAEVDKKAFVVEVHLQGIEWRSTRCSQQWWTRMFVVVFPTTWEN